MKLFWIGMYIVLFPAFWVMFNLVMISDVPIIPWCFLAGFGAVIVAVGLEVYREISSDQ